MLNYGEDIVLLEYKFTNITQEAKYGGSIEELIKEIRLKYVKNRDGEWKGIGQLANSINKLFSSKRTEKSKYIDVDKIKRIYPVLVTFESFLNSPLTNYYFNKYFNKLIDLSSLRKNIEVRPLTLISIEDLEASEPYLHEFNKIIEEKISLDPKLYFSFADYMKNKYRANPSLKSEWIDKIYQEFRIETKEALFGK